ncbi:MAG: thioredoxin domain-containing protein [Candidatus Acidiferrales bacterium]
MRHPVVALMSGFLFVAIAAFFVAVPVAGAQAASPATVRSAQASSAPASPADAQLLKSTESFLRELFAWGPEFKVKLGPLAPSSSPDFYSVPVQVTINGQTDAGSVYVSHDGKTLFRGDMFNTASDPFAADRAKIHLENSPSRGPADAKVVVVEYSDFQCPHCRELYDNLKTIEPQFPQVRFVFKSFPLTQIHPWAETAAVGARCAYLQSPSGFWKVHDALFDNQEFLSVENIYDRLLQYAAQANLDADAFKACLAGDDAKKAVAEDQSEGVALGVNSTPTVYVNGRSIAGGDKNTVTQFIQFELAAHLK